MYLFELSIHFITNFLNMKVAKLYFKTLEAGLIIKQKKILSKSSGFLYLKSIVSKKKLHF